MPKFIPVELNKAGTKRGFSFQCPGCGCAHYIQTSKGSKPQWDFDGNIDRPTVNPSVLVRGEYCGSKTVCHSFIKNGEIRFLTDCTHELAGKTVELPEWK